MKRKDAEKLRQSAETRLRASPTEITPHTHDLLRLVHELEVHQIELEIQNEELLLAREELEESRNRYLDLYEFAPVGYLSLSHEGRIAAINLAGADLLGENRSALLHRHFTHLVAPVDQDRWHRHFEDALQQVSSQTLDIMMERANGSVFTAQVDTRVASSDDEPSSLRLTLTDITRHKEAEVKLELAAKVFAYTREAIMVTAADGTIIEVNEAFTRITGYGRDEVLGRDPRFLISDNHTEDLYVTMWRALASQGYWQSEVWNRRKDGRLFAELLTVSAILDAKGNTRHYVALFSGTGGKLTSRSGLDPDAHGKP